MVRHWVFPDDIPAKPLINAGLPEIGFENRCIPDDSEQGKGRLWIIFWVFYRAF